MMPPRRRLIALALGIVICAWGDGDALASPSSSRSDSAITSGHECGCHRCAGGGTAAAAAVRKDRSPRCPPPTNGRPSFGQGLA